jgi:hypothetical protein
VRLDQPLGVSKQDQLMMVVENLLLRAGHTGRKFCATLPSDSGHGMVSMFLTASRFEVAPPPRRCCLIRSFSRATKLFQPLADSFDTLLSQRGSSSEPATIAAKALEPVSAREISRHAPKNREIH